jgi:protein-tyrosine phosphatase
MNLLKSKFRKNPDFSVAVHCVLGLRRAPVLVAFTLTECGVKHDNALQFTRPKKGKSIQFRTTTFLGEILT